MTDIDQLEAGRELDALVAEKVMGWPHITDDDPYRHYKSYGGVIVNGDAEIIRRGVIGEPWKPSTDIAAAWEVFSHHCLTSQVIGSWVHDSNERPELPQNDMGYAIEWFCTSRGDPVVGLSAPHAICLAALKAVSDV
jgi:hypothetical protein